VCRRGADRVQARCFVLADQRQRYAIAARSTGAADAVDVVFRDVRQLVIHHQRQLGDVQPSRGDVGRHQHPHLSSLEVLQSADAGRLALVAVQGRRAEAGAFEVASQPIGAVFGAGEHQRLAAVAGAQQVRQQRGLAVLIHRMDLLVDEGGGGVARRYVDGDRIVQQLAGELADRIGQRGRKQQVLPAPGQQGQNAPDRRDEAHIQHPVGFVQHQNFDAGQVHVSLADVIQQSAGRGDQQIHPAPQGIALGFQADAADQHRAADRGMAAVDAGAVGHLSGQLAGGRQHQSADEPAS